MHSRALSDSLSTHLCLEVLIPNESVLPSPSDSVLITGRLLSWSDFGSVSSQSSILGFSSVSMDIDHLILLIDSLGSGNRGDAL